jgi:phage baseplate assembly protein V
MLRYGHITELDASKGMAKVKFDEDDFVSDWLQIVVRNTISNKSESWFDVNEFVAVMMDKHDEEGIILGAVYHEGNTPPIGNKDTVGVTFPDGTTISYNRSSHTLNVDCTGDGVVNINCKTASVTATESVTVDTPTATFTGDVTIDGELTAGGSVTATGDISTQGSVEAGAQVSALSGTPSVVRLSTHMHPTAAPGPPSPPTPGT